MLKNLCMHKILVFPLNIQSAIVFQAIIFYHINIIPVNGQQMTSLFGHFFSSSFQLSNLQNKTISQLTCLYCLSCSSTHPDILVTVAQKVSSSARRSIRYSNCVFRTLDIQGWTEKTKIE